MRKFNTSQWVQPTSNPKTCSLHGEILSVRSVFWATCGVSVLMCSFLQLIHGISQRSGPSRRRLIQAQVIFQSQIENKTPAFRALPGFTLSLFLQLFCRWIVMFLPSATIYTFLELCKSNKQKSAFVQAPWYQGGFVLIQLQTEKVWEMLIFGFCINSLCLSFPVGSFKALMENDLLIGLKWRK